MKTCVSISPRVALALVASAAYLLEPVAAHSWVEALMRIAPNGTMVGPTGYPRGYQPRNAPGRTSDEDDVWLLPPNGVPNKITAQMNMCRPGQRSRNNAYSASAPMLKASPGDFLALRYQENGHVTLPSTNPTKPTNRGTVYIYGTSTPSDDEKFEDVWMSWTPDGNGGNGKGRLLATRNFDDGQCYQVNGQQISQTRQRSFSKKAMEPQGADLWCQNDIQLPADIKSGRPYTLYWVWHWPSLSVAGQSSDMPTGNAKITVEQFYTSCVDVDVSTSGASQVAPTSKAAMHFAKFDSSQDRNNVAILSQLTGGAFQAGNGGSGSGSGSGSGTNGAAKSLQPGAISPSSSSSSGRAPASPTSSSNAAAGADQSGFKTVTVTQSVATVTVTKLGSAPAAAPATETAAPAAAATTATPGGFSARPLSQAAASISSVSVSLAAASIASASASASAAVQSPPASEPTFTVKPFLPLA